VFSLSTAGAEVIPRFEFLRANNNKVFMELLRDLLPVNVRGNLSSYHFGTLEEMKSKESDIKYPVIIKGFYGAMGRNVFLARDSNELQKIIRRKISFKSSFRLRIKEYLSQVKHKGYRRDSFYRGRFVVQRFIPGLQND
jgi:glutathione synthase/RimK-type ligase-like ATP-grasp enzyme